MDYGFGRITIRSPYAPDSIYFRGTVGQVPTHGQLRHEAVGITRLLHDVDEREGLNDGTRRVKALGVQDSVVDGPDAASAGFLYCQNSESSCMQDIVVGRGLAPT